MLPEVKAFLSLLAGTILGFGFGKLAKIKKERREVWEALFWKIMSVIFYLGGFLGSIYFYFGGVEPTVLEKVSVTLLIVVGAWLINKYGSELLESILPVEGKAAVQMTSFLRKLFGLGVFLVGLAAVLAVWGVEEGVTAVIASAGVLGVITGFATQKVLSNFVSGVFLYLDRPFEIGDFVEILGKNISGRVVDIGVRATILENEGKCIIVPNSFFVSNPVVNHGPSRKQNS